MEPVTAAVAAFSALKAGVAAGKEITSLAKEIGTLWNSIDEITHQHNKKKSSVFRSVEEEALDTFMAKKKAEDLENQLREIILYSRGMGAWQELVRLRADIRKKRQEDALAAKRKRQQMLEVIAIAATLIVGSVALFIFVVALLSARNS
jgi:hypothetical protein